MWRACVATHLHEGHYVRTARETVKMPQSSTHCSTLAKPDDPGCLLRASVVTGAEGRYAYTTILPGEYPGRPRHIHYRVSHKGYATLVTQLYFARERGVPEQLVVTPARNDKGVAQATFDITLASAAR